jgi:2-hydroxychromene-2-carboxylate isomerase
MVTKTLEFIFDFASPNAYLVMQALPPLLERTGADLFIIPALLGGIFKATNNVAPFVRFAETPLRMSYEMLEVRRFIADNGITKFQMNPHFPINTITIMRGAMVAERDGYLRPYVDAVLRAMWEEGKNMGDAAVVAEVLTASGFDSAALLDATQEQPIKDALAANTARAVERGVFGIPTFFVGDEMFFGKERLAQVERALIAR